MLRDVFYYGNKPNVHPREKFAKNLEDARQQCTTEHFWIINEFCDYKDFDWDFDFDFLPDEDVWTSEHNNVWPSKYQKDSGTWLCSENESDIVIYRADVNPIEMKNIIRPNWDIPDNINRELFDFKWHPDPTDPAYIYQFGTQWHPSGGPTYSVPGATSIKYIDTQRAVTLIDMTKWEIIIPITHFDFSWSPSPLDLPYIYVFGNKWNDAETEPTLIYKVDGATEFKFVNEIVATPAVNKQRWTIRNERDNDIFDFSWRPNPKDTPAIYEWGEDGPLYTDIDPRTKVKFEYDDDIRATLNKVEENNELVVQQEVLRPMFFVDRGNPEREARFAAIKARYPHIQKTRYLNSWVDTISRCAFKCSEDLFWVLTSEVDYSEFDFNYNPNPWQKKMLHVFGTQWSHWGNTYLTNKSAFLEDTKYVKIIEHLNAINFVKDKRTKAMDCLYDVLLIDHGNSQTEQILNQLKNKIPNRKIDVVKYDTSYIETLKAYVNILEDKKEHYIWVCSSVCDYGGFDFSYICDPYAKQQLHVFPSGRQKQGDTFLFDVNKFKELQSTMRTLDWYSINYNYHQRVSRLNPPEFIIDEDTHVSCVNIDYDFPYAVFKTHDNSDLNVVGTEPMCLWSLQDKSIQVTSTGATRIVAPIEIKEYVKKELYDYPYISRAPKLVKSKPLDIVFLSNGEKGADENYEHLLNVTRGLDNRVVRVDGVNGRVQAYHAAAEASNTPWMFTVFAKLRVDKDFDWSWQPDRLQVPKHYIFNATNPVNGLVYGHQAMIAYNKRITLANNGRGLDFTLDDEHEVVDMNSGIAIYNTDEWSTWRTSFREVLKLRVENSEISRLRMEKWLNVGNGDFARYSTDGALHAIEYYEEVGGDIEKLKLSYDWPWLRSYYEEKYK